MLTVQQFIKSFKRANVMGERRRGHFDHDAKSVSGPTIQYNRPMAATLLAQRKQGKGKAKTVLIPVLSDDGKGNLILCH